MHEGVWSPDRGGMNEPSQRVFPHTGFAPDHQERPEMRVRSVCEEVANGRRVYERCDACGRGARDRHSPSHKGPIDPRRAGPELRRSSKCRQHVFFGHAIAFRLQNQGTSWDEGRGITSRRLIRWVWTTVEMWMDLISTVSGGPTRSGSGRTPREFPGRSTQSESQRLTR